MTDSVCCVVGVRGFRRSPKSSSFALIESVLGWVTPGSWVVGCTSKLDPNDPNDPNVIFQRL